MREELLVQRDGVGLRAEQMETERFHTVGRETKVRTGVRVLVDRLVVGRHGARTVSCSRRHATQPGRAFGIRAWKAPELVRYSALTISNGQRVMVP